MIDPLYAMETVLTHFYKKALLAKYRGAANDVVDAAMLKVAEVAEKVAPYRHAKYAAIKVTGDANATVVNADASSEEIRAQIIERLIQLAPVLELETAPELQDTVLGRIAAAANHRCALAVSDMAF